MTAPCVDIVHAEPLADLDDFQTVHFTKREYQLKMLVVSEGLHDVVHDSFERIHALAQDRPQLDICDEHRA